MRIRFFSTVLLACLSFSSLADSPISGVWKHSQKPAWLSIAFENGTGSLTVKRHDNNPKAAGLNVIQSIKPTINSERWSAKMFSADDNGYIDVSLVLADNNTLFVFDERKEQSGTQILKLLRSKTDH